MSTLTLSILILGVVLARSILADILEDLPLFYFVTLLSNLKPYLVD
jgi:hypothetical protein